MEINIRKINNGWLASYQTYDRRLTSGDYFGNTPEEVLAGALAAIAKATEEMNAN